MLSRIEKIMEHSFIGNLINSGSVVLDIGANKGEFASGIIEKFGATVYAIEPVPELFSKIPQNKNLKKFNYCISDREGKVELSMPEDRCATLYPKTAEEKRRTIIAEGITFDAFVKRNDIQEVDLLKLDIEGAEIPLFRSVAPEILRKMRQITVEFHDFLYPETKEAVMAIKKKLELSGFYCIAFSFTTNGDVLFVRRDYLSPQNFFYLKYLLRYKMGAQRLMRKILRWVLGRE